MVIFNSYVKLPEGIYLTEIAGPTGNVCFCFSPFEAVARCPGAVATASYSLAEVQAGEDGDRAHWLRQLALLQLGLAMFPLAAHEECTQWPLRGRDLVSAFSRLGHKLFKQHRQPESRVDAGKVAVVSACGGLHTEFVRSSAQEQFRQYAERHGYLFAMQQALMFLRTQLLYMFSVLQVDATASGPSSPAFPNIFSYMFHPCPNIEHSESCRRLRSLLLCWCQRVDGAIPSQKFDLLKLPVILASCSALWLL